jgi:two-component system KDP operon response regulator KdpE
LLAEVWGPGYTEAAGNLRLYMTQLRRKLEPDPARPRWLHTEPGMGYRYQPDPAPPSTDGELPAS